MPEEKSGRTHSRGSRFYRMAAQERPSDGEISWRAGLPDVAASTPESRTVLDLNGDTKLEAMIEARDRRADAPGDLVSARLWVDLSDVPCNSQKNMVDTWGREPQTSTVNFEVTPRIVSGLVLPHFVTSEKIPERLALMVT